MRVEVRTICTFSNNYGQKLQIYALQNQLNLHGIKTIVKSNNYPVIRVTFSRLIKAFRLINWINLIKRKRKEKLSSVQTYNSAKSMSDFVEKYKTDCREFVADGVIVGSDQVWNYGGNSGKNFINFLKFYFLKDMSENTIKISYAASWGSANPKGRYAKRIAECLKDFDYVSVREKDGIDKCRACGRDDAVVVPDPTLLLQPDDYRELYKNEEFSGEEEPYVFFYYLDNGGKFNKQSVFDWAASKGLKVIYVTANGVLDDYEKCYPTIPQWIWLVEHAEYVVTNSYHGTIFSLLFERKFGSIMLNGENEGMNSRFDTLWEICNVSPRIIDGSDFSTLEKPAEKIEVDYTESDKLWTKLKQWDEEINGDKS